MSNLTQRIRLHYNLLAPFYYGLWGQHVHHGFWEDAGDRASQAEAQERLIRELYRFGGSPPHPALLDVGCGYGGSLLWLARNVGAQGLGITLSPMQQWIGQVKIRRARLQPHVRIAVADAQQRWPLPDASVDLVWCVECSEHLADRVHFAREAHRVLRPGGRLCLAAWLAGPVTTPEAVALRQAVEQGMLCYPFSPAEEYARWCTEAGLEAVESRIITPHVVRTWDICIGLRERPLLRRAAALIGGDVQAFTASFTALQRAYAEGAMEYGLFTARRAGAATG
jgi:tocopherol O-methyltransferase